MQIEHLLNRSVSGLSSGDRQRVALGRAIVREPKAFLMDEPLGALDTEFRHVMTGELRALHDRLKATTIYVTHDQLEAMAMADRIAVMNRGLVEQVGAPREIYDRPASMFVADFIGSPPMNLLGFHGRLEKGSATIMLGENVVAVPTLRESLGESELVLGVRPEEVQFIGLEPLARRRIRRRISRDDADHHLDDRTRNFAGARLGRVQRADRRPPRPRFSTRKAVPV